MTTVKTDSGSTRRVLVSGGGIAGPAVAWWLARAGWEVTVVERSSELRDEGQNVDIRGIGREVIRRMGLEDAAREHHTSETGTAFVDQDDRAYASFAADATDTASPSAELEILRGQLARLLNEQAAASATYLFGDRISGLADDGAGVDVRFAHAPARRFDAVVIAEGTRSRTRDLVFATTPVKELGLLAAYATIPRTSGDDRQWRLFMADRGGRTVHLRPDNVGSTRAMLGLKSEVRGLDRLDRDGIVTVLRATFGDLGWETPRILAALDDAPLYVDQIAQVRLPSWHRGRVVLLGDAAWSAGPFGTGTTNALAGAYVLAGELATTPDDTASAFARYEQILRPSTEAAQAAIPHAGHPRHRWEATLTRAAIRAIGSPLGKKLHRVGTPPVAEITLPNYPMPRVTT